MADMVAATKIGKKWASGMEDLLMEVLVNIKKIAIEAVEVIGINKHVTTELHLAKTKINKLHIRIGELSSNVHKADTQTRTYADVAEGLKDDGPERPDPPPRTVVPNLFTITDHFDNIL